MKILLIGINFFGYDKKIKESLELLGSPENNLFICEGKKTNYENDY